jgi:hypothetical protein
MSFFRFLSLTTPPFHFRYAVARSRFFGILVQSAAMTAAKIPQTSSKHLTEIAEILAAGLMRLAARKSSPISTTSGDIPLDISAPESGHPIPENRRTADG